MGPICRTHLATGHFTYALGPFQRRYACHRVRHLRQAVVRARLPREMSSGSVMPVSEKTFMVTAVVVVDPGAGGGGAAPNAVIDTTATIAPAERSKRKADRGVQASSGERAAERRDGDRAQRRPAVQGTMIFDRSKYVHGVTASSHLRQHAPPSVSPPPTIPGCMSIPAQP